ncbi:MAG: hypothetical protein EXR99_14985 [Gemmataceae bacterium]|nr:hypothetical protein [Gemmataceae bacterium]
MILAWKYPWLLAGLAILPLLMAAFNKLQREKAKQELLWLSANAGNQIRVGKNRGFWLFLAFALVILALAGPILTSETTTLPIRSRNLTLVIPSLPSVDCQTRLQETLDSFFLEKGRSMEVWRLALVTLVKTSDLLCPLTRDREFLRLTMEDMRPDQSPGSFNPRELNHTGKLALEQKGEILFFLDKVPAWNTGDWTYFIQQAKDQGVPVYLAALSGILPQFVEEGIQSTGGKTIILGARSLYAGWISQSAVSQSLYQTEERRVSLRHPHPGWFLLPGLLAMTLAILPISRSTGGSP